MRNDKIRYAGMVTDGDPSAQEIARVAQLVRPHIESLLSLSPQERFNVMGSLLCTFAVSHADPTGAFDHLVSSVRGRLAEVEQQAMAARSGGSA
jgi:hypothetical protein